MLNAIKRLKRKLCNKTKETHTEQTHEIEPLPTQGFKKIALIVGHTREAQGAKAYTGEREWAWNNNVATKVKYYLQGKKDVKIFYRDKDKSYKSAMKAIAKEVKEWGADFSLELHFNSFEKKAYGCEILVAEDAKNFEDTIRLADEWTDKLASKFNLKQRRKVKFNDNTYGDGVKVCKVGERGYWNLGYLAQYGIKTSFLIEPMFANLETDESRRFFSNNGKLDYVMFLVDRINEL